MDGNGRWAKKRALNRLKGHKAGIEAVRETIRCASDLGVRYLTIYSFSTENWRRPQDEVIGLMDLFAKTMLAEVDGLHEEHVRVMTIGDLSALPAETREAFDEAWRKTRDNDGMTLIVAVNYGARQEILHAVEACMRYAVLEAEGSNKMPELTEEVFERGLYTGGIPDPELLIRTSGEMRVSISCCGRSPIRSSSAPMCSGPISIAMSCCAAFSRIKSASGASGSVSSLDDLALSEEERAKQAAARARLKERTARYRAEGGACPARFRAALRRGISSTWTRAQRRMPPRLVRDPSQAPEGPPWHYDITPDERAEKDEARATCREERAREESATKLRPRS